MKNSCSSRFARIKHPSNNDRCWKPVVFDFWRIHRLVVGDYFFQGTSRDLREWQTTHLPPWPSFNKKKRLQDQNQRPLKSNRIPCKEWDGNAPSENTRYFEPRLPIDQCLMIFMYSCWLSSLRSFGLVICLPVISYLRIPHRNITWGFAWLVNQKPSPNNHSLSHLTAGAATFFQGAQIRAVTCVYTLPTGIALVSHTFVEKDLVLFFWLEHWNGPNLWPQRGPFPPAEMIPY